MSSIPNKAMPHAAVQAESETPEGAGTSTGVGSAFGQIADKAREYPKTAIAAGAAVAAGVAAAAVPGSRGRSENRGGKKGKSD